MGDYSGLGRLEFRTSHDAAPEICACLRCQVFVRVRLFAECVRRV